MAIQTLHDTGEDYTVLSKYDGGVYGTGISDCVCKGIGDEFTINYAIDSLNISFNAGSEAVIGGSFFKVTSLEAITLTANATIYLCANIDLSRPNGETGAFVQRTSTNMRSDNINGSGQSRDLLLYVITTGANGVVSVSDRRIIKGDGTSISGLGITLANGDMRVADNSNNQLNVKVTSGNLEVTGNSLAFKFRTLTQAQYSALSSKDSNTLYFTTEN